MYKELIEILTQTHSCLVLERLLTSLKIIFAQLLLYESTCGNIEKLLKHVMDNLSHFLWICRIFISQNFIKKKKQKKFALLHSMRSTPPFSF